MITMITSTSNIIASKALTFTKKKSQKEALVPIHYKETTIKNKNNQKNKLFKILIKNKKKKKKKKKHDSQFPDDRKYTGVTRQYYVMVVRPYDSSAILQMYYIYTWHPIFA
jgi:hypothetical protein